MPRLTFEYKITVANVIQIAILVGGGIWFWFTVISATNENTRDIAALQKIVTDIPGIKSDVLLLQNTMTNRAAARDAQIGALSGRVDRIETSVSTNLADIAKSMASMQADIAAINATLAASKRP